MAGFREVFEERYGIKTSKQNKTSSTATSVGELEKTIKSMPLGFRRSQLEKELVKLKPPVQSTIPKTPVQPKVKTPAITPPFVPARETKTDPGLMDRIETSKLWRTLIGNPEEGFGVGDMAQAITMANPQVASLTGLATGKLVGGATKAAGKAVEPAIKGVNKTFEPATKTVKSLFEKTPVPVKQAAGKAVGIGAALTGYETVKGATDKDYARTRQTFPSQFGASLRIGTGDAVGSLGNVAERQGNKDLAQKLQTVGKNISTGYENKPVEFTWKSAFDPDFYANNLAQSLPTTAMLIPAALIGGGAGWAAAGRFGASKFLKTIVASLSGAATSRPLESAIEAGSGYIYAKQKALNENKSEAEAERIASEVGDRIYKDNMKLLGLDAAQFVSAFVPAPAKLMTKVGKPGVVAGKLGFGAGTEALEEGYQEAVSNRATGEDLRSITKQIFNPTPEAQEAMFIGGIIGVGFGGAGVAKDFVTDIKKKTIENLPEDTANKIKERVDEQIQDGVAPKEAIDQALDEVLETPEVKEIVKKVTQEEAKRVIDQIAPVVYDKNTKEPLKVIDRSNPYWLVVENNKGQRLVVSQDDIIEQTEAEPMPVPADKQAKSIPIDIINQINQAPEQPMKQLDDRTALGEEVEAPQVQNIKGEKNEGLEGKIEAPSKSVENQNGKQFKPGKYAQDTQAKAPQGEGVSKTKEPWEMSRTEYVNWYEKEWQTTGVPGVKADTTWAWDNHKFVVEQAIKDGKTVPEEVLRDYPDIIKTTTEAEAEQVKKEEPPKTEIEPAPAEKTEEPSQVTVGDFTITKTKHTKTGEDLWVVKPKERLSNKEFTALNAKMRKLGGGYSRFTKGFNFKEDPTSKLQPEQDVKSASKPEQAKSESKSEQKLQPQQRAEQAKERADKEKLVKSLRNQADRMQKSIDAKKNPAIGNQNPTARRARIAAGMYDEAERLEAIQSKLYALADAIENNTAPSILQGVKRKSHIETIRQILNKARSRRGQKENIRYQDVPFDSETIKYADIRGYVHPNHLRSLLRESKGKPGTKEPAAIVEKIINAGGYFYAERDLKAIESLMAKIPDNEKKYIKDSIAEYKHLSEMGVTKIDQLYALLQAYLDLGSNEPAGKTAEQKIKEMERALIGTQIPGYFPTPKPIVAEMLEQADIEPGMKVLEPSAGNGNIADAIREAEPEADLVVIEVSSTLRDILEAKGYTIIDHDFLEHQGEYDRIVMNPPFEKGQDIDHVRHAFSLLKPGGKVVAIMSEGTFFRGDKKATEFREWLDEQEGTSEKLPEKSFTGKDALRQTGVAARMVVIDKPEVDPKSAAKVDGTEQIKSETPVTSGQEEEEFTPEEKARVKPVEEPEPIEEFNKNFPAGEDDDVIFYNTDTLEVLTRRNLALRTLDKLQEMGLNPRSHDVLTRGNLAKAWGQDVWTLLGRTDDAEVQQQVENINQLRIKKSQKESKQFAESIKAIEELGLEPGQVFIPKEFGPNNAVQIKSINRDAGDIELDYGYLDAENKFHADYAGKGNAVAIKENFLSLKEYLSVESAKKAEQEKKVKATADPLKELTDIDINEFSLPAPAKKPSEFEMGLSISNADKWLAVNNDSSGVIEGDLYSNQNILVTGKPPYKHFDSIVLNENERESSLKVSRILPGKIHEAELKPILLYTAEGTEKDGKKKKHDPVLLLDDGENIIMVRRKFHDYFASIHKGSTFHKADTMIAVKNKDGKLIGIIAPTRIEALSKLKAADIRNLEQNVRSKYAGDNLDGQFIPLHKQVMSGVRRVNKNHTFARFVKVEDGTMLSTNLEVSASTKTSLPDGYYKIDGNALRKVHDLSEDIDFPDTPAIKGDGIELTVSATELKKAVKKAAVAVAKNHFRQIFMSVWLEVGSDSITVVASDTHKLYTQKIDAEIGKNFATEKEPYTIALGWTAINALTKGMQETGTLKIAVDKPKHNSDSTLLSVGNAYVTITARTIDDTVPNFRNVILPNVEKVLSIDAKELKNAVKEMISKSGKTENSKDIAIMELTVKDDSVIINSYNSYEEDEVLLTKTIPAKIDGESPVDHDRAFTLMPFRLRGNGKETYYFNLFFLRNILNALDGDAVYWGLNANTVGQTIISDTESTFSEKTGESPQGKSPVPENLKKTKGTEAGIAEEKITYNILEKNNITYNEDILLREGENTVGGRKRLRTALAQLTLWEESDYDVPSTPRTVDRSGGVRTIALGITRAAARTGRIDLRGKKADTPKKLATLAQVFRNPSYETFRIFYLKDDTIVAHEGVTSRLPGTSAVFVRDKDRDVHKMKQRMQRLGADGYYLLHNHPSGDSAPSVQDLNLTKWFAAKVPGFKGHVVIDSNEYSYYHPAHRKVDSSGRIRRIAEVLKTEKADFSKGKTDALLTPAVEHVLLGQRVNSDHALARMAKDLQLSDDMTVLIYTDSPGYVRAIQEVPNGLFNDLAKAADYIRGRSREFGARNAFAISESADIWYDKTRELVKKGILQDAIEISPGIYTSAFSDSSVQRDARINSSGKWMGKNNPVRGTRVQEKGSYKFTREQLAPIFYSQLRRVIEQKMPNKAVPNQVLAIIKSGQVKTEELKWSGIEDWLKDQTGRVSKDDVLAFLDANDVQIEEALKDDDGLTPEQESVLFKGQPKFKKSQEQDLAILQLVADERKIGPFTIGGKVKLAPEALERPVFKAASEIAEKLGLRLVVYNGKGARGAQYGRTIYINESVIDPISYVFWHEVGHSLEVTHTEHYEKLLDIALEHIQDYQELQKHYEKFQYDLEDMPHEFAADVFAEALSTPGFFGRVAENAPELIKTLLEAIDKLVARVKKMVSKDDSVLPYLKNLETLRQRVRDEVAIPYFHDAMGEKKFIDTFGEHWQDPAAKAKSKYNRSTFDPSYADIRYKVRKGRPPKKTITAYKLMRIDKKYPGKLFPLFVSATKETPVGIWLDAEEGEMVADSKTGSLKVKSRLGGLAYRPGWHLGDIPLATHIGVKGKSGKIEFMNPNHVWCECDVSADVNYQKEANANGVNPKTGKINRARADIKKIPVDGYYRFKTNPNMIGEWIIAGSIKINRVLSDEEAAKIVREAGYEPLPRKPIRYKREGNETTNLFKGIGTQVSKAKKEKAEEKKPVKKFDHDSKFTLPDEEISKRIENARGLKPETLKDRFLALADEIYRKGHREFEHLPRTGRFAEMRNALLNLRKARGIANERTGKILGEITHNLTKYEYDVFTYKVIFDDLSQDYQDGKLLPFGLNEENFEEHKQYVDEEAESLPNVMEAIDKRHKAWAEVKNEYIKAQKAIGHKVEDKLKRENYYRHQVLEYANARGVMGAGKKLRMPTGRGFLKKREGSSFDINTDYLQAEYEVMAQMMVDTHMAKVIGTVKKHYDIINQLKAQAVAANNVEMLKEFQQLADIIGDPKVTAKKLYRQTLNKKQAIAFSQLYKLAAKGELPTGENGQFEEIVEEMAQAYQEQLAAKAEHSGAELDELGIFASNAKIPDELQGEMFAYLNYLAQQTESEVASIKARTVFKGMAEKKKHIKKTLGKRYVTWEDLLPEGYATWQPREGHVMYMANTIPEGMAEQLFYGIVEELGITADVIKKELVVGQKYPEMVIPEEVALTLEGLGDKAVKEEPLGSLYHKTYRGWKQYQLISPRRFFKYNFRNFTGDFDAVLAGNPSSLKKMPQALNDLWEAFFTKERKMSSELNEWFKRGGFETLMQAQEINDINRNRQFQHLMERKTKKAPLETMVNAPKAAWLKYWDSVRTTTDFREALLRYATFLDYAEQIENNNGKPNNFGASNRDEIMALHDPLDRAAKLANELLGAYDEVSVIGTWLADNLFPFWRWNEVNFVRYNRLIKNAYIDGKLAAAIAGKATGMAIRSPIIAMRVAKFVIQASALSAMIVLWNGLFFSDEEDDLPDDVKERLHIIFGRDKDGNVLYFSRLGALQDFLEWFGFATPITTVKEFLSGKKTIRECAIDIAKEDISKLVNALTPFIKSPVEAGLGVKLYPDVFNWRPVRDRMQYLAESFALGDEYKALTGKPTRGYASSLTQLVVYKSNPDETAYYANKDNVTEFKKKIGKHNEGYSENQRSDALYNLKLAIRYGDQKAFEKYLLEYATLGGTVDGLKRSVNSLHPLYGLSAEDKRAFIIQLDQEGVRDLTRALEYYEKILK